MDRGTCEDLKAFERRLTEIMSGVKPATNRWRALLVLVTLCMSIGAYYWIQDSTRHEVSYVQSLYDHPLLTVSFLVFIVLLLTGIHKRVMAPSIMANRTRSVLSQFNMSCDDNGKLILKPRPTLH